MIIKITAIKDLTCLIIIIFLRSLYRLVKFMVILYLQDIDFTQGYLNCNVFETPLWKRILEDTARLKEINSINAIKHQALAGNLRRKKAQFVVAVVESVDRSAIDPLITIRDQTGILFIIKNIIFSYSDEIIEFCNF